MSLSIAGQLLEEKKYEEARTLLTEFLEQSPEDPHVRFWLGCLHDSLGDEREAIPFYEKSLELGVGGVERERAYVQLGSTYRTIGDYTNALRELRDGRREFPENKAILTFYTMALYNRGDHREAMELLLNVLVDTSGDEWVNRYQRALRFYAAHLDETW